MLQNQKEKLELQNTLKNYTTDIIENAWPQQKQGIKPKQNRPAPIELEPIAFGPKFLNVSASTANRKK